MYGRREVPPNLNISGYTVTAKLGPLNFFLYMAIIIILLGECKLSFTFVTRLHLLEGEGTQLSQALTYTMSRMHTVSKCCI